MSISRVLEALQRKGMQIGRPKPDGEYPCQCPLHDTPKQKHLGVKQVSSGAVLVHCVHEPRCNTKDIMAAIGLTLSDLMAENGKSRGPSILEAYDYTDEGGKVLFQVVRFLPKDFRQRRPDGSGGWIWNIEGVARVPFRLPRVTAAIARGDTIYIPEGEKDALRLEAAGVTATTNAAGAGKFTITEARYLALARVVVLPDNDTAGELHGQSVARLAREWAASVKVLHLPGLLEKGDVSDWLDAGHTKEELEALALAAPEWEPSPEALPVTGVSTWETIEQVLAPIEWDWPGWLPRGMMTMVASMSGVGKSLLALRIADCYLRSSEWPDGTPFEHVGGEVLWLEGEAAQAINLQRAKGWGLPLSGLINPFPDPLESIMLAQPEHRRAIREAAQRETVALVVVDSLSGVSGTDENSKMILEVLLFLAELARDNDKPVILLHHLRKPNEREDPTWGVTLEMVRGHTAIVQLPRVIWTLDLPGGPGSEVRRLQQVKNSFASYPEPLGMVVSVDGSVDFVDAPEHQEMLSKIAEAKGFLLQVLRGGPLPSNEIFRQAKETGIAQRTLNRAKGQINIVSVKREGQWMWAIGTSPRQETPSYRGGD